MRRRTTIIAAVAIGLTALAVPTYLMQDLFQTPTEVAKSRRDYAAMKDHLFAVVDSEVESPVSFENEPAEQLLAYLNDHLELRGSRFADVAITPIDEKHVLLSKKEKHKIPLDIVLSLEVEIQGGEPKLVSLRRGSRELPKELAWVYFGEELDVLASYVAKSSRNL